MTVRFLTAGRRAVLVELDGLEPVLRLDADLRRRPPPGVVDIVPAARTVLVTFDSSTDRERVTADLTGRSRLLRAPPSRASVSVVEIPVVYDGPDLVDVARHAGLSPAEVVRRHRAVEYEVAFGGFAPGFAYLVGTDPALHVPRRSSPRERVPAGAVGLAGEFSGVYPRPGPGGWQLVGRTDARLWDLARDPPALLPAGTRVRFVEVTR